MDNERPNPELFTTDWERFRFNDALYELSQYAKYSLSNPEKKIPSTLRFSNKVYSNQNHLISISSSRDIDDNVSAIDKEFLMKHAVNADAIEIKRYVASPRGSEFIDYDSIILMVYRNRVVLIREMITRVPGNGKKTMSVLTREWKNDNLNQPFEYKDFVEFDCLDRPIKSSQTRMIKGEPTEDDPEPKEHESTIENLNEYFDNIRKTSMVYRVDGFEKISQEVITVANDDGIICSYDSGVIMQSIAPIKLPSAAFTFKRKNSNEEKVFINGTTINVRRICNNLGNSGTDSEFTVEDIATLCTIINPKFNETIEYLSILKDDNAGIPLSQEE